MRWFIPLLLLPVGTAFAEDVVPAPAAGDLPGKAQELRDKGMDAAMVTATLKAAKDARLSAGDTAALFAVTAPLVEKHGPVEKFDEFLAGKLGEGLRGEELTKAVTEAHTKGGTGTAKPTPTPAPAKPVPAPPPQPSKLVRPQPGTKPVPGGKPAPAPGRLVRPGGGK